MAEIFDDPEKILDMVKEKQANEQEMLLELNKVFNQSTPKKNMRRVVLAAFERMNHEIASTSAAGPALGAVRDEAGLAVWSTLEKPTSVPHYRIARMTNKLINGDNARPPLDSNDLSELIRVIGAWLEKGGGVFGVANINMAYRAGFGKTEPGPTMKYLNFIQTLRKKYGWQYPNMINAEERAMLDKLATTGDYIALQGDRDNRVWSKAVRQREDKQVHPHQIEGHVADFWVRPKFNNESGMQLFRANRNDLCKKIDLLFGFIIGATISGTTTDTVMVLEAFGSQIIPSIHAGYYLFPVATIAASLHHSLLEAGLALTATDVIDNYCAGFYTTLVPKGGLPAELQEVAKILKKFEESPKNHHMLIWYNGKEGWPVGCIKWNKQYELYQARKLVEGKRLLTQVNNMPKVPDRRSVIRLMEIMAPGLFVYLPNDFRVS